MEKGRWASDERYAVDQQWRRVNSQQKGGKEENGQYGGELWTPPRPRIKNSMHANLTLKEIIIQVSDEYGNGTRDRVCMLN